MALGIRPLTDTLGAEILGLEPDRPWTDTQTEQLRAAWRRHRVLLLRGTGGEGHAPLRVATALADRREGLHDPQAPAPRPYTSSNTDARGALLPPDESLPLRINWFWHIDGCYLVRPHLGAVLCAGELPDIGGETEFADLREAWEQLPPRLRERIEGRTCDHRFASMVAHCGMPPVGADEAAQLPHARHPLVRRHHDGRCSLMLSPPYMDRIDGLTPEQTRSLVEELTAWATQDRFVMRHRWQPGDLLAWDNRSTMHRVMPYDIASQGRVMRGASLAGIDDVVPGA